MNYSIFISLFLYIIKPIESYNISRDSNFVLRKRANIIELLPQVDKKKRIELLQENLVALSRDSVVSGCLIELKSVETKNEKSIGQSMHVALGHSQRQTHSHGTSVNFMISYLF